MARLAGEALTKVTLNLRTADVETLRQMHPQGYQLIVRDLVKEYVKSIQREADETLAYLQRGYK